MKHRYILLLILVLLGGSAMAQQTTKHEARKNSVVKEYKQKAGSKTNELDKMTTYDAQGRRIEEVEYASYGQKERTVYEYDAHTGQLKREVEYDDKNHVRRIRKYEYNANGTRHAQYTYKPDGKLASTRTYEYIEK